MRKVKVEVIDGDEKRHYEYTLEADEFADDWVERGLQMVKEVERLRRDGGLT